MARYALVIGISDYQSSQMKALPKAVADAEAVAQVLERYGNFRVTRLPSRWNAEKNAVEVGTKAVTAEEVGQAFKTLLSEKAEKSEALIYFSGHGFKVVDSLGKETGYLAASNTQIEMNGDRVVEQRYGISLASLNDLIQSSNLSSLVLLLDCCHSGFLIERQLVKQTFTAFSILKDYYLITACRSYETAKSLQGEPYGIFTGIVLRGLAAENANANGQVTADRLFDFISSEFRNDKLKGMLQEPVRGGWGNSICLVSYPKSEVPVQPIAFNRENPYRGLYSFEEEQSNYFYGREDAVRALLERLRNGRFLAVIGASGCGKSSLVKAGLIPQLKRDQLPGSKDWEIEILTPGKKPYGNLSQILDKRRGQTQPYLLFIDQFEEVFTLCESELERKTFIQKIASQVNDSGSITHVIVAMRGDFLDRCGQYEPITKLINRTQPSTYIVEPLSEEGLVEAIAQPADLHNVEFEPGLVEKIVQDVEHQPGALPLLQYALYELWRVFLKSATSGKPCLTWKDYEAIGGVEGALNQRADNLYTSLPPEAQHLTRCLFLELVKLGDGESVTRKRATMEDLMGLKKQFPDQFQPVIEILADQQQRLIVTNENTVEVAHEALLTEWKRLYGWIQENRDNLRTKQRLAADCQEWVEKPKDGYLLTGSKLDSIIEWQKKHSPQLTKIQQQYIQESIDKRDSQRESELKRVKREFRVAVTAGILGVFTLGLGLIAQQRILEANRQEGLTNESQAFAISELANRSEQLLKSGEQLEAVIVSIQGLEKLKSMRQSNKNTLSRFQNLITQVKEYNNMTFKESANTVSYNPKHNLIATADNEGIIRIFDKYLKVQKVPALMKHKEGIVVVNFSPNGEFLVSSGYDNKIKIWRKDGKLIREFIGHEGVTNYVTFHPTDNNTLISAGQDEKVIVWSIDLRNLAILPRKSTIINVQQKVWCVNFSPDGRLIATAGENLASPNSQFPTLKIWKNDGTPLTNLVGHTGGVTYIDFAANNKVLVSVGADGQTLLWYRGENDKTWQKERLIKNVGRSYVAKFSPDGRFLASGRTNGSIQLWDFQGKPANPKLLTLERHESEIYDLSFSPDSRFLASASLDKRVKIWNLLPNESQEKDGVTIPSLIKQGCQKVSTYLDLNKEDFKNNPDYSEVAKICQEN